MLKIVDYYPNTKIPFPLKELEKFGFKYDKDEDEWTTGKEWEEIVVVFKDKQIGVFIDTEYWKCFTENYTLDLLFDLIQAGLVEKVEEEK